MILRQKTPAGFTLTELLVGLAIFSTAVLIITDIFVLTSRSQRKGAAFQKVQSDARVIMSTVSDQIRQGTVNYNFYGGPIANPVPALALLDADDRPTIFRKSSDVFASTVCPSAQSTPCLEISRDNGVTWAPVTSRDVKLQFLKFYIAPNTNPFLPGGPNIQPRVTLVLGIQGTSPVLEEQNPLFLQTTVSSRVYKR